MINSKKLLGYIFNIFIFFGCLQNDIFAENVTLGDLIIALILAYLGNKVYEKFIKAHKISLIIMSGSVFFAVLNTLGLTLYYEKSIKYWGTINVKSLILIMSMIGTGIIFSYLCILIFSIWDKQIEPLSIFDKINFSKGKIYDATSKFVDKHTLLSYSSLILMGWLPWLIIYYPGSINWDLHGQLAEFFHISPLANHHPVLSTLIVGTFAKIGKDLGGSYNIGIYAYILVQSIFCAMVYSYLVIFMKKAGCNKLICFAVILWYSLLPLWGGIAQFGDKDVLFCAFFCFFAIKTYEFVFGYDTVLNFKSGFLYVFSGIISCLLRNNVIYMLVVALPFIMIAVTKNRIRLFMCNCIIIIGVIWVTSVMYPVFNVLPTSKGEALSLMFQQTARVVREHKEQLTITEEQNIDNVLDMENIGQLYNPVLSDAVKRTYKLKRKSNEADYLKQYYRTWWKMGIEFPIDYIDATIGNSFGYYSFTPPIDSEDTAPSERFFNRIIGREAHMNEFNFHYLFNEKYRDVLYRYSEFVRYHPVCGGIFYQCAFYTWAYVAAALYLLKQRKIQKIGCIILPILTIAVCCVSPVNDCFRYYITAAALSPILFCIGYSVKGDAQDH